jgi:AraC-like DNA-binding protein/ligand-binding sensor protein
MDALIYDVLAKSRVLREFKRGFREATGLSLTLAPTDGPPRRLPDASRSFCALMAQTAAGCGACMEVRQRLEQRLGRDLAPQKVCCFAGMVDLAVPIVVGGRHAATLFGGQVFCHRPGPRQFEHLGRQLRERGMIGELRQAKRAYFQSPVVSPRQLRGAVRLLTIFASEMAESANRLLLAARSEDPEAVAKAKIFARDHAHERVALCDVAAHVHLSKYHFCKTFKKSAHMTFTEFLSRLRIENAKRALGDRNLSVTQVSDRAGFNSIAHFNRVFRRYAGRSPTAYRVWLRRQANR